MAPPIESGNQLTDDRSREVLAVGTQLPDVIDKPLAWTLGELPNGRSLGPFLPIASQSSPSGGSCCPTGTDRAGAVTIGYAIHRFTDALRPIVTGEYYDAAFIGWPLVPPVDNPTTPSFIAHLTDIAFTPWVTFQVGLLAIAAVICATDGLPGAGTPHRT